MPSKKFLSIEAAEKEIDRLESDLYLARRTIIGLMPEEIGDLLRGYYSCKSREEGVRWMNGVVETLIERADSLVIPGNSWGERRAMCPLCNQGSSSPYVQGYSLPEGLRRHLAGWGNTGRCVVMETVSSLAHDYWREEFAAVEQEAWQAKQAMKANRRKTEPLYLTSPESDPKLLDDGWGQARSQEQLAWVEDRLISLGFRRITEDNIVSWLQDRDDCVVYADPRIVGRIDFEIWRKPLPKFPQRRSKNRHLPKHFHMLDTWKNDLAAKYAERIAKSLADKIGPMDLPI